MTKKILFISSSVGLGHVVRDLEIAKELRNQIPDSEIIWLAGEPVRNCIEHSSNNINFSLPEYYLFLLIIIIRGVL
jgi:predicted glycosyltransferase